MLFEGKRIAIDCRILHKGSDDDVLIENPKEPLLLYLDGCEYGNVVENEKGLYSLIEEQRYQLNITENLYNKLNPQGISNSAQWNAIRSLPFQALETLKNRAIQPPRKTRCSSSFTMINDAAHYYFYRKMHEHVPGVMFMEAARQAVYYHLYHQTGHQCGDVTLTLDEMNSKFFAYAELMYPIEVVLDDMGCAEYGSKPKYIDYRVSFYQNQRLLAIIDSRGAVINLNRFKSIRNIDIPKSEWFAPINRKGLLCEVELLDGKRYPVDLVSASVLGSQFKAEQLSTESRIAAVHIALDGKLLFCGRVQSQTHEPDVMSVQFEPLDLKRAHELMEIIKRAFVHVAAPSERAA